MSGSNAAQEPDAPTAWPRSLIPKATPSESPGNVGSSWISPFSQIAGLNCRTWGAGQTGSGAAVSANPTTSPRLLLSPACPLLPPSVSSAFITPACQRKGRHVRWVPKPQKSSPFGSGVEVSERPTAWPLSFGPGNAWLLGPPSVPRSVITPFCQTKACTAVSRGRVEKPCTCPLLLMPNASLNV